jgi:hypothetical protein
MNFSINFSPVGVQDFEPLPVVLIFHLLHLFDVNTDQAPVDVNNDCDRNGCFRGRHSDNEYREEHTFKMLRVQ